jgi:gliding motility-associated-like protein
VKVVVDYKLVCNNIVSPNGDGKNDTWIIQNISSYPNNKVMIFDRTGRMIYEKENYDNQWNGTINSRSLHEGTYYYVFIVDGGKKIFKGYIELL